MRLQQIQQLLTLSKISTTTLTTLTASMLLVACSSSNNQKQTTLATQPTSANVTEIHTQLPNQQDTNVIVATNLDVNSIQVDTQSNQINTNQTITVDNTDNSSTSVVDTTNKVVQPTPVASVTIQTTNTQPQNNDQDKGILDTVVDKIKETVEKITEVLKENLTADEKPEMPASELQQVRIDYVLRTGETFKLENEDTPILLQQAIDFSKQQTIIQQDLLKNILTDSNGNPLNQSFSLTNNSIRIIPEDIVNTMPLIQSDTGLPMAGLSQAYGGRGLAYGSNVLAGVANQTDFVNHTPIFNNAMRWIATNNPRTNPTTLTVATVSYDVNIVKRYFKNQFNIDVNVLNCDVFSQSDNCWQNVDVVFLGNGVPNHAHTSERVKALMMSGKGVVFMPSGWNSGNAGQLVGRGMGLSASGYGGNYWENTAALTVTSERTLEQSLTIANRLNNLQNVLETLKNPPTLTEQLNNNHVWIKSIQQGSQLLQALNETGKSVFDNDNLQENTLGRYLVAIADSYRKDVVYQNLNVKNLTATNSEKFLKTYVADSWLDFKRRYVEGLPQGAGDYMPATAKDMAVSDEWETITITLPQASGTTLIGRASVPSKPVEIQIVENIDNTMANFKVQTGFLRAVGNPFDENGGYARPRRPQSYALPISDNAMVFNSPFGGVLMLNYNNTKPNTTITLRIKGSAKYAHYDFTQNMSQAEIDEATKALQTRQFGWNTFKFAGAEIQQTTDKALQVIGTRTPQDYVKDIKTVVFDSNHIANGYNNMPLANNTQQYCNTLGWDCTSDVHKAPNVQHFVGWIAQCGFLCSGNPSDGFVGIGSGWGWVHELGHNTVQRVLSMTFKSSETGENIGCGTECDNNILAGLSMLRKYELYGEDINGHNFDYWNLYRQINESRATGKTGEALRLDMEKRLWSGNGYTNPNPKQGMTVQLAMLYTKARQNKAVPDSEGVFEFFRLLNIANRLVNNLDMAKASLEEKNKYGLGVYSDKSFNTPELVYMLSSKIMGIDLKKHFEMYGLPVSAKAHQSVALLNLPVAELDYYAKPKNSANRLKEGQWVKIPESGTLATYPYPF